MMKEMGALLRRTCLTAYFTAVLLSSVQADRLLVTGREGRVATLQPAGAGLLKEDQMLWTFRPDNVTKRIANVYGGEVKTDYVERFTGRLQLDGQTGSLTITDLNINDSGFYEGQVFNTKVSSRCFQLIVYRSLSPPYIKLNTSRVGRGCGSVTVECSVENSRGLTVSWYRGEERLNQTSSLDTSANLSLALEIQDQDDNIYRCLAKNPVDAQATELHIEETCLRKRDSTWCCQTLATVRLVLSSVVGVAMIVIVVDHFRPTSSKR